MPIVSSIIVWDQPQRDGRRFVREAHTDHLGVVHHVDYIAAAGADMSAPMAARLGTLESQLADREMQQNIAFIVAGEYGRVTANYISLANARAAIRALYQTESGEVIGRLAGFLLTLSDAQLRTLFAMTQSQVNQLKPRLQAKVDALAVVLTAVGE